MNLPNVILNAHLLLENENYYTNPTNNPVALKLPTFWPLPAVRFAQVATRFVLRNITSDVIQYYYVVAPVQATASRDRSSLYPLLKVARQTNKYFRPQAMRVHLSPSLT